MALEKVEGEHFGEYLTKVLMTILKGFSLEEKVQFFIFMVVVYNSLTILGYI